MSSTKPVGVCYIHFNTVEEKPNPTLTPEAKTSNKHASTAPANEAVIPSGKKHRLILESRPVVGVMRGLGKVSRQARRKQYGTSNVQSAMGPGSGNLSQAAAGAGPGGPGGAAAGASAGSAQGSGGATSTASGAVAGSTY